MDYPNEGIRRFYCICLKPVLFTRLFYLMSGRYSPYPSSFIFSFGIKRSEALLIQYRNPPLSFGPSVPTDRRYYTYDQYLQFKGIKTQNDIRQVVIYARVSTKNQKDDLQNQVSFLRQFCNARGIIVDQCMEEYGSGLNYNRKKWNK